MDGLYELANAHSNRGLKKLTWVYFFLAGNFDDHTIIIPKLIFSWMVGGSLDAGITCIIFDAPSPRNPREYPHIYVIFIETKIIGLHFAAGGMGLSSLTFFWWAP